MAHPNITGVHLVGSTPLPTEEECFRAACKAFPGCLKRIADGEPGIRYNFAGWQRSLFDHEPRVLNEAFNPNGPTDFTEEEMNEILKAYPELDTQYDEFALNSYETFKKLRDEGAIPQGVRFLVCLPTPLTVMALAIIAPFRGSLESRYEAAILRSLTRIQNCIPASDLTIQWDLPLEFAMLEGESHRGLVEPWFEPMFEGIIERLVRLGDSVNEDVELGYHFCYGDLGHKHFIEPKDTLIMVNVATALLGQIKRRIDYIHMPVPKDRTDREYFKQLQQLNLGRTELVLGLAHYDDLKGTETRIQTAGEFVQSFGVSTECGLGRTPPEQLENIWSILADVSEPTKDAQDLASR